MLLLSLQVHLYLLTSRRRPALKPVMAVEIHQRCYQVSEVQFVHFIAMIEHQFDVGHCRQAVGGLTRLMAVATVVRCYSAAVALRRVNMRLGDSH